MKQATAIAHPNIAFIKYWGNRDPNLRIPENGSISMNLADLSVKTTVSFGNEEEDCLILNGTPADASALQRVSRFLDLIRGLAGIHERARVISENDFPTGAGIASSAAAFAALALAATAAVGLHLSEKDLSRLARKGSGSACRSIPGGYVEWLPGETDEDSYAVSIAPPEHWALTDCIAILSTHHKPVGSTEGHALASTSPLQSARVADTPRRLNVVRRAILERDFPALAEMIEHDSNLMHAVMMTSTPPLFYWEPVSLTIMKAVREWRASGLPCGYTLDAGPNVHVLCPSEFAGEVTNHLKAIPGVQTVLLASAGGPARLVKE
ncbi:MULTISPECIES: diphosphomevalonate decarboxylase [Anaerolinea]|uniref:diphosphomevalonate decarboxylase n=1 Tax=Anaerolinea TaxID=233189 RepID=UPI0026228F83|nr:diphosphomevalonate decarboxylase [Anaerolinea thermophila]